MTDRLSNRLVEAIPSRIHRRIFTGSLSLNALIIGIMIGDALFIQPPQPLRSVEVSRNMLFDALPRREKKELAELLRRNSKFADLSESTISELAAVMSAEHFDAAGFTRMLSEKSARVEAAESELNAALVARLATLTPAERRQIASELDRRS